MGGLARDKGAAILVPGLEGAFVTIGTKRWGICTDDSSIMIVSEFKTRDHMLMLTELPKLTGELILDGKANAVNASVLGQFPLPEEGIASTPFPKLTLIQLSCLTQRFNVNVPCRWWLFFFLVVHHLGYPLRCKCFML